MPKKDKIIILIGMPGAGKGAICTIMKWQPNIVHISTGELFRRLDPASELGKKVNAIMAAGGFVGDDIVNEMLERELVHGRDILLDGYPRNIFQAEWLIKKAGDDFDIVAVLLEMDEKTATFRRDKRINDYLLRGEEPRKDDTDPSVLPRRFAEYREKTEPTIAFLREKLGDKFFAVDGRPTLEDVYDNVMKVYSKV